MTRFGGFPQGRILDIGSLTAATKPTGAATIRESLAPGPEREAALIAVFESLRSQADELPALIDELRDLMAGRELTQLISSVAIPASMMGFAGAESMADGESTSSWAAKIEYLVGVALSLDHTGHADTPRAVTQRVVSLVSDIFDADQARMIVASLPDADGVGADANRGLLLQQLRLEYQSDRMPGYATHLEQVDAEVFGRHREYYSVAFGFDPSDVIRVTRRYARSVNQAFSAAREAVVTDLDSDDACPRAAVELVEALDAAALWTPEQVAAATGVAVEQIAAMLDFFSTTYGSQPGFRTPGDRNQARTHPCIKLEDATYFVPDPWSLSAVIHNRLTVEPKRDGFDPQKYHKHRQDAHERLVARVLQRVFGIDNVPTTQHYDPASEQHGEIDALVLAEWPLVVEAKAIALTDAGRRAAPSRVDKKVKEILGKALDQTERVLTYILEEGGRAFARTHDARPIELIPREVAGGTAVIVTFERIDPFAFGGLAVAGAVKYPTWVVCLTDLMMVADVLADPASLHHYARLRAGMHAARASAATECDALGAYLHDRLSILNDADAYADEATRILITNASNELNDFYTRQEFGLEVDTPTASIAADVAGALASTLKQAGWSDAVNAVMSASPTVWTKWKKFRHRHRNIGVFVLDDHVSLVATTARESTIECANGVVRLHIPAAVGR
ncbi:hypothetical protein [Nocardia brasiliensis]|uniref:hypothetical protein n=1 Tax=Nocardia brasiliensis TaxID=37326 RepID=UPI0018930A53|nr:hypothetical protein [Nocardia brasiliensis]MBF6543415.1 hypothetical protein [Nocardia brasiliensis]